MRKSYKGISVFELSSVIKSDLMTLIYDSAQNGKLYAEIEDLIDEYGLARIHEWSACDDGYRGE